MGKNKSSGGSTKAAAKAAKKAKAVAKVERSEKKKITKSKNSVQEDDDDLEGILEKVCVPIIENFAYIAFLSLVDAERMGRSPRSYRRTCGRTSQPTRERIPHSMSERCTSVVHWWRILQR